MISLVPDHQSVFVSYGIFLGNVLIGRIKLLMENRRVSYRLLIFTNINEGMQEAVNLYVIITGEAQTFLPAEFFWNVLSNIIG